MPKVSVIIPNHNYGRFLRQCLDSLFAQRAFSDFEVTVIEDGSTDDSAAILRSYSDPRLHAVFRTRNEGHISGFNTGFARSTGEYVVAGNADDFWAPDFLAEAVKILDRHPDVGLVHSNFGGVDGDGRPMWDRHAGVPFPDGFHGDETAALLRRNYITPQAAMWRRTCLDYVGGRYPDELPFAEDWNLYLNIARRHALYFIDRPLAYYRAHGNNVHLKLARAREKERCELLILSRFFAAPDLKPEVRRLRAEILTQRYFENAHAYFNERMRPDVLRCMVAAAKEQPSVMLKPRWWQRVTSGVVPEGVYQAMRTVKWKLKGAPK